MCGGNPPTPAYPSQARRGSFSLTAVDALSAALVSSNPTDQDDAMPNLGIAPSIPWLSVSAGRGASDARHS